MNTNGLHKLPPLTMDPEILKHFKQPPRDPAPPKAHTTDTESPSTKPDDGGAEDSLPANETGDHTPPAETGNPTTEETQ